MLALVISVTYETDITGYGRKMGRHGGNNGINMDDPHPFIGVEIDQEVKDETGRDYFKVGSYTLGEGIRYRTENPGGSHAEGSEQDMPRKTGKGLPWDL